MFKVFNQSVESVHLNVIKVFKISVVSVHLKVEYVFELVLTFRSLQNLGCFTKTSKEPVISRILQTCEPLKKTIYTIIVKSQ